MTLLFGHVRRWRGGDLEAAYAGLDAQRRELLRLSDELAVAQPPSWRGDAAEAAYRRLRNLTERMEQIVAEVAAGARAVGDIADEVAAVQGWVAEAESHARHHGLRITHAGEVEEAEFNLGDLNFFERNARKNELREMVSRVMRRAHDIDAYLSSVFERIVANQIFDGGMDTLAGANIAGDHEGSLHAYLLNKYHVSADPDGLVMYPDGPTRWALELAGYKPQRITTGEAQLLDDIGLAGLKDAYDIYKTAIHDSQNIYAGLGKSDGHSNAFQHAYWNAMLANRFGQDWTAQYTTAHERVAETTAVAQTMDLHNNEVGLRIAAEHPSAGPEELRRLVDEAVRRGDMVVVGVDGTLVRSNEIPMGDTGAAKGEPPAQGAEPIEPADRDNTSGGYHPGTDGDNYGTYDN